MQYTSTLKPAAMMAASLTSSDSVAQDAQARDTMADGDAFDEEATPGVFRRIGLGLQRILARLTRGSGNTSSRNDDTWSGVELSVALAEGRRQVVEERKAARKATREARAQLARERRESRIARRQGLLRQQLDDDGSRIGHVTDRGQGTIRGIGPVINASTGWTNVDERPERGLFMRQAHASVQGL